MDKEQKQLNPNPAGAGAGGGGDVVAKMGVPVLTGPQIRLRIANILIGQGVKLLTDHLRIRLDEIFAVVMANGKDRAQLRYEVVELAAQRGVDITQGDVVLDMINALDAVVQGEPKPATMAERRAKEEKGKGGKK